MKLNYDNFRIHWYIPETGECLFSGYSVNLIDKTDVIQAIVFLYNVNNIEHLIDIVDIFEDPNENIFHFKFDCAEGVI
jgi:hypothetical protein